MIKYRLVRISREIIYRGRMDLDRIMRTTVKPGCTLDGGDVYPVEVAQFDVESEALAALARCKSDVYGTTSFSSSLVCVEEYMVDEDEYDEDGEYVQTISSTPTPMPAEVTVNGTAYRWVDFCGVFYREDELDDLGEEDEEEEDEEEDEEAARMNEPLID